MNRLTSSFPFKDIGLLGLSRLFERASYYGVRALLVIYMTGTALKMETEDALHVLTYYATGTLISSIIGGILGDLSLGGRRAMIVGGLLQATGAFTLGHFSLNGVYLGLTLIIIGSGLYYPNNYAEYGRRLYNRIRAMDPAFSFLFIVANIGAYVGITTIGFVGETTQYIYGFTLAGIVMLASVIMLAFTSSDSRKVIPTKKFSRPNSTIWISFYMLMCALFYLAMDYILPLITEYKTEFLFSEDFSFRSYFWNNIEDSFTSILSIVFFLVWIVCYYSRYTKLILAFVFGAMMIGFLLVIPKNVTEDHVPLLLIAALLYGLAHIHLAPIVFSAITEYGNPKYFGTLMGSTRLPTFLLSFAVLLNESSINERPRLWSAIVLGVLIVILAGLLVNFFNIKKNHDF